MGIQVTAGIMKETIGFILDQADILIINHTMIQIEHILHFITAVLTHILTIATILTAITITIIITTTILTQITMDVMEQGHVIMDLLLLTQLILDFKDLTIMSMEDLLIIT